MPQTKQKPAAPKASRKPKVPRRYAYSLTKNVPDTVRGHMRERLREFLEDFQKSAWPEERTFLLEVMENWDNTGGGYPRDRGEFAPPLYAAVSDAIDRHSNHLVSLPDKNMVGPVERYIDTLVREGISLEPQPTVSVIRKRRIDDSKDMFENEFLKRASDDDLYFWL